MQTAALAVALAALSLGAQAAPIPVPATIDSPLFTVTDFLASLNPRIDLVAPQNELFESLTPPPPQLGDFDGSVPPIPGPVRGAVLAAAEPPTFLTLLGLLSGVAAIRVRQQLAIEKRRRYRRRIRIDFRQLA